MQVVDLLAEGLTQAQVSPSIVPMPPHPKFSTTTPPAPPPCSVPVVGISMYSPKPAVAPASSSDIVDIVESAVPEPNEMKASDNVQHINPVLVQ